MASNAGLRSPLPGRGRENGRYVRYLDHARLEGAITELAKVQHLVFSLAQLVELGLTRSGVHKRVEASRLHRIHQAVYSLVPAPCLTREGRWMAAVLACGDGAVLSHRTAAALHELRSTARVKIGVTVPRRSARRHTGVQIHRSITLTDADITTVNGIPCTTVARVFLELGSVLPAVRSSGRSTRRRWRAC